MREFYTFWPILQIHVLTLKTVLLVLPFSGYMYVTIISRLNPEFIGSIVGTLYGTLYAT